MIQSTQPISPLRQRMLEDIRSCDVRQASGRSSLVLERWLTGGSRVDGEHSHRPRHGRGHPSL